MTRQIRAYWQINNTAKHLPVG